MGLKVYLMISRNKDNKLVPNFKERTKSILEYTDNELNVFNKFEKFASEGVPGETSRLYGSVNDRDENKIRKALLVKLIEDEPPLNNLNKCLISVSMKKEQALDHKWLFDFDSTDRNKLIKFTMELDDIDIKYQVYQTPNGYAIVVNHGFDTRSLFDKFGTEYISLKRDDMLFMSKITKE